MCVREGGCVRYCLRVCECVCVCVYMCVSPSYYRFIVRSVCPWASAHAIARTWDMRCHFDCGITKYVVIINLNQTNPRLRVRHNLNFRISTHTLYPQCQSLSHGVSRTAQFAVPRLGKHDIILPCLSIYRWNDVPPLCGEDRTTRDV